MFDIGDGGIKYYGARLSLNNLRECEISAADVEKCKFGFKITQKNHHFEYGTHYYYQVEIFVDGQYKDIDINGIKISYLIDYKYTYYRTYCESHDSFTIEGVDKNDKPFEISFEKICNSTNISSFIFAFILISEIDNFNELEMIWKFLFSRDRIEIGASITLLNKSVELCKSLISKYSFMERQLKAQLDERVKIIKEDLEKIIILK